MSCGRDVSRNGGRGREGRETNAAKPILVDASGGSMVPVEFDQAGNGADPGGGGVFEVAVIQFVGP